jgi:acetyltransferase
MDPVDTTPHTNPTLVSDVFRATRAGLDAILSPRSVAVVGATEKPGSVGRTILWNLVTNPFGGTVFPVNPNRPSVLGIKSYPGIGAIPDKVDLAVIVTPAPSVPDLIGDCVSAGVPGAIIISAGFKETGPEGAELEHRVLERARAGNLRIIGPNCLGVMNPATGLNATFAAGIAKPGRIAFLSQSGALCTAVLDWSIRADVGFSAFVSVGSMLDVGWGDLIDYLGDDPRTQSIILYMESIGDARTFLSAAREVALTKPIIALKPGRTEAASRAAASHTGSLTGSDDVLDAAFRRCGVLRVDGIDELFSMAEVLAKQPRPRGPRLTIITNAGGPGVLATDALISGGGELAPLDGVTLDHLSAILPAHWSHNNPIDVLGDAGPERYVQTLEVAAKAPNSDGLLVILTPQAMTEPTATAERLKHYARLEGRPILSSWMGGPSVAAGEEILLRAGIPTFPYPDIAARAFNSMWRYSHALHALYETPSLPAGDGREADRAGAAALIAGILERGRTLLTEFEAKHLLSLYNIATVPTRVAATADEAVNVAESMGYPVVVKLHSETITHKTDVGGVRLDLPDAAAVRDAFAAIESSVRERAGASDFGGVTVQPMVRTDGYELIVGSSTDPQFGPVLLFGSGGQLVEVFKDRSLGLPPLTTTLARRMMERTRIHGALKGVRGRAPIDLEALAQLLVRFAELVVEQPRIKEIDINPLVVSPERFLALDARVVIHGRDVSDDALPRPAIRPYPNRYVASWTASDGTQLVIRPIRPEDEPLLVQFHQGLSEESVYNRYFQVIKLTQRVSHDRLTRICFLDYDREIALVAERWNAVSGTREILGVGRLSKLAGGDSAEFALLIHDSFHGKGLGRELLQRLLVIAREERLRRVIGYIHPQNAGMLHLCEKAGFALQGEDEGRLIRAEVGID